MKSVSTRPGRRGSDGRAKQKGSTRVLTFFGVVGIVVIVIALMRGGAGRTGTAGNGSSSGSGAGGAGGGGAGHASAQRPKPKLVTQSGSGGASQKTSEAVVADKVSQFSRGRRQLAETLAQRFNVILPPDVDRFFSAVEAGEWREVKSLYNTLSAYAGSAEAPPGFASVWPALKETYAVAEARTVWPADQLLAYGQTMMAAMKPGMAYVGSSTWGSSIPSLLGETSGDGKPVVLDHSMLANPGYLEYLGAVYGDRLSVVSADDAQKAKEAYFTDLAERAKNNQLRPGEDVPSGDSREITPGSFAGSEVSERLLLALLEKNPSLSVAIEKPVPGSVLYEHAFPMGPVFEVSGSPGGVGGRAFTSGLSEQTVQYWKDAASQMQTMGESEETMVTRRSLAEMAVNQAGFLASRSLAADAEQTYRAAVDLAPTALEASGAFAKYLQGAGRAADAQQVLDEFLKRNPSASSDVEYFRSRLADPKR